MRAALIAAGLASALGGVAWGQAPAPSPMMAHYRAYIAANERGDFYEAEKEATAALAAAEEARSPRIGVLATNLARVRAFLQNDLAGAAAPAARALEAGGVDEMQARTLVALTHLSTNVVGAPAALESAIETAAAAPAFDRLFLYQVADAWGAWAFARESFEDSVRAYGLALKVVSAMGSAPPIELASALIGRGKSYAYLDSNPEAATDLYGAVNLLRPYARETSGLTPSSLETVYSTALAWQLTMLSKLGPGRIRGQDLKCARSMWIGSCPARCSFARGGPSTSRRSNIRAVSCGDFPLRRS